LAEVINLLLHEILKKVYLITIY